MSRNKLRDEDILELLGDGRNSDLSDFSDEEDIDEHDNVIDVVPDSITDSFDNQNDFMPAFVDKRSIKWKKQPFVPSKFSLDELEERHFPEEIPTPLDYFMKYITDNEYDEMATHTNTYAQQNGKLTWIETNSRKMKIFVGVHLLMGVFGLSRIRMYWEQKSRINIVADNITRNRFFELRSNFYIMDNNDIPINNKDRFVKVRPIYNILQKRCNELPVEKNVCVDEQMVPFKGKLSVKQYMPGKPNPWGIKLYLMCGESGLVYDFLLYQGSTTELNCNIQKVFGLGGAVVLKLTMLLKKNRHFLYMDNFFTSFNVLHALQQNCIYSAGTIRVNRFANPPFISDKELSKMGRGSSFEVNSNMPNSNIGLIKWYDNKAVGLGSNFITSGVPDDIKRYDKKEKTCITVNRPEIVKCYNQSMGGVDKHDQLVSFFRTFIKSRKWTLRMITHAFDIACVNSWLEYKLDCKHIGIYKTMDLLHFKKRLGETLILVGKTFVKKRGRPSNSPSPLSTPVRKRVRNIDQRPFEEVRFDHIDHLPTNDNSNYPVRCKNEGCKLRSPVKCTKCGVHFSFTKRNECFRLYHIK
ncbi:hypothetical protein AGLY_012379 [Aphis glycines]|uniref:PiggyBac transposable element-derived protein domain-containing protein n=1 Tax=Aphis glycines TaxID=307491 RepID=A0A6G0TC40_APHGL|nr:hypothetical protein AGLY_012379 [Aphis glycines]